MNAIVELINRNSINAEMFLQKVALKTIITFPLRGVKAVAKGIASGVKKLSGIFKGGGGQAITHATSGGNGGIMKYIIIILVIMFIIYLISKLIKGRGNKNNNSLGVNIVMPPSNNKKSDNTFGWK